MLTKWVKALSLLRHAGGTVYSPLPAGSYPSYGSQKGSIEAKDVSGTTRYISPFCGSSFDKTLRNSSTFVSSGLYIGSDGTPATDEDHALGSVITTLTGSANVAFAYDAESNKTLLNIDITLNNNTGEDVTIREVGYVVGFYASNTLGGSVESSTRSFLGDRTVLDTPMTIPSGEAGLLRYQFQYPGLVSPTE